MQYAADQENEINISVEGYDEERYMHVNVKKNNGMCCLYRLHQHI